ncbi:MAG TPA: trigger factor [Methylomirabilota bacterium]|nr:trigger factor [Methylomirabilota bacterium]
MQVTETNTEGLKREFKVIVPAHEVQDKIEGKLTELGRRIRLPGFRPGKVPLPLLKQRYGQTVRGEVVEQAVNDSSARVMSERGLRAAGQPQIEILSAASEGDLEYKLAVELIPDIKPMDFSTLEIERLVVETPEKEVDEAIERTAKRFRKSDPVATPRPAQSGDVVVIDFTGRIDGQEFAGGAASGHYLELGSNSFIPGFEEQLQGASAGDRRDVKVTFPADYPNAELAGKEAVFDVEVKEVRQLAAVVIDDELAKSMGAENVAALRDGVRKRVSDDYAALARGRLKRQLLDALAAAHEFEVPAGLVETEFSAIWSQIEADRAKGRLDPDDADKSEDQLKKEYRDIAARRVKLGLLLSEVGRINNIQVANDELSRAIVNEARRYPGQEKKVIEYYQKTPQALIQLRAPLYEEKVVDFIVELAKVSERKVTPEELAKELAAPQADEAKA